MTGEEATMMYRLMDCNGINVLADETVVALIPWQLAHERRAYEECRQRLASKVR